ncbi:hypothetical protein PY093_05485 [Cytobacillus sp. S13-E01]|uniref:hypothetical protein n=1 Tax=Cytobacillus sp. S13-E01 TaxID=3031326 RepID=UPI0023D88098|nr:hypothetical protein [Cytobacillus sp. S13-E01]MDF0726165.1 hypothetical protein [Cytobacillus sp. S13-E01]
MLIKNCKGYELEKAQSNTSEDFFNRSEVTFSVKGEEKTFHLLYIRYFDEVFASFTPYEQDPIFNDVEFKDIVGLVCLLKNPGFQSRKRVYINSQKEFENYFKDIQFDKLPEIFESIRQKGSYELESPLHFIAQPR